MKIKIETQMTPLPFLLRDSAPDGVRVDFDPPTSRRDVSEQDVVLIIISTALSIPAGVLSAWLYDQLKGKKRTKITMKRRQIDCEDGELRRLIEEEMTYEEDQ
jgi:hypothetical protein